MIVQDRPTGGSLVVRDETDRVLGKLDPQMRAIMAEQFTDAQISFLLQRTPRREIRYREGPGGRTLAYVEHAYVTEKLNQIFGFNWSLEIMEQHIVNNEAIVKVRLMVRTAAGGEIVKEAYGGQVHQPNTELANTIKGACSDGLKKAASLLGIGIDLYRHDDQSVDPPASRPVSPRPQRVPTVAATAAPAKLDYSWFWKEARVLGYTPEQVHARLGVKALKDLEEKGLSLAHILALLKETRAAA
jgi:hypothetical protein